VDSPPKPPVLEGFSRVSNSAVRVKICGLTRVEEAVACVALGADWIGVNFHAPSLRSVSAGLAAEIIAALPDPRAAVGVFVDRSAEEVAELAARLGLQTVQLHGQERPEELPALRSLRVIKAFRLGGTIGWKDVTGYITRAEALGCGLEGILIDANVPGEPGGTGIAIGDEILDCMPRLPRLILAGGLTPGNVVERIARVRPWMVDVASGVESAPGRKDLLLVAAFIRAAHGALGRDRDPRAT
jgi:phosphoribosylanthranilate isomerase